MRFSGLLSAKRRSIPISRPSHRSRRARSALPRDYSFDLPAFGEIRATTAKC